MPKTKLQLLGRGMMRKPTKIRKPIAEAHNFGFWIRLSNHQAGHSTDQKVLLKTDLLPAFLFGLRIYYIPLRRFDALPTFNDSAQVFSPVDVSKGSALLNFRIDIIMATFSPWSRKHSGKHIDARLCCLPFFGRMSAGIKHVKRRLHAWIYTFFKKWRCFWNGRRDQILSHLTKEDRVNMLSRRLFRSVYDYVICLRSVLLQLEECYIIHIHISNKSSKAKYTRILEKTATIGFVQEYQMPQLQHVLKEPFRQHLEKNMRILCDSKKQKKQTPFLRKHCVQMCAGCKTNTLLSGQITANMERHRFKE